jgi:Concanavalin A-like lectin/glucanases superfamily
MTCLPKLPNNDNHFIAGAWMHEAVTYDGSHIREYTNGQLVNDWPATGAALGQGEPMAVGAWPQYQGFNVQGRIDEFQIIGRALMPEDVQDIYNRGR